MIPSYYTRKMIWLEMLGSVSELNLLLSRLSCTSVALLDKIQLCKLDLLDLAPAAVSLLIPSKRSGR
jgi:hypothetical protein